MRLKWSGENGINQLMKRSAFVALVLLICGCRESGASKRDPAFEEAFRQIRLDNPGMTQRCLDQIHNNGPLSLVNNPECYEMMPAQRWNGLWNTGWEWTNFCPDPAKTCDISSDKGDIWLTFAPAAHMRDDLPEGRFRIEFIGRRTKVPGHFGHLGQYDYWMIVDRVISIGKIPGERYTPR